MACSFFHFAELDHGLDSRFGKQVHQMRNQRHVLPVTDFFPDIAIQ
jgi:hypothetical protein